MPLGEVGDVGGTLGGAHPPSPTATPGRSRMLSAPERGDRPATTSRRWHHLVSELLTTPLDDLMAEARRLRPRHRRHVLAEGLRPADDALPRRLRLLHVRPSAAARRARLPHRGRGARDRTRRRRGRLHRGAVHARRPAGGRATSVARDELAALGCATTLEYLARCAGRVLEETGLLPHLNPGVMTREELVALRPVAASMGIMLETDAERLAARGGPHWASPDKLPARRLETMRLAGRAARSRSRAGS